MYNRDNMKTKLTTKELIAVASMLFGLFFGAGNLIFPVYMGQMAGKELWTAIIGFLITGVTIPILAVASIGITKTKDVFELSSKVNKKYALVFTCALYLTIGPLFAIPRCATTSFTVGIEQFLSVEEHQTIGLLIFTIVFFGLCLYFSLRPGKILTYVGKILNPAFLVFLGILLIVGLSQSNGFTTEAVGNYATSSLTTGLLEGYNTMDALAGLAFGVVVIQVINDLGIQDNEAVAKNTLKAGILSGALMSVIYILVTMLGASSTSFMEPASNGGIALAKIAQHYLGNIGLLVLALAVTLACLKTAVGLVTSCAEMFVKLFPNVLSYKKWAVVFCLGSFVIANFGLNQIISLSLPVLMYLYPLAIVLVLLSLFGKYFDYSKTVYTWTIGFTCVAAIYDLLNALPEELYLQRIIITFRHILPFSSVGFGWVIPALIGFVIGFVLYKTKKDDKSNKINKLYGSVPKTMTLEESKEERINKI